MIPFLGGSRVVGLILIVVLVAVAARVIWWALTPMFPFLIGLIIAVIAWKLFYKRKVGTSSTSSRGCPRSSFSDAQRRKPPPFAG
ncbi:MAG: hypothetical protein ACRDTD_28545 [Pseudonocardiaceae bacterium]